MELPKTAGEYAIWVGMQFPVLGAAVVVVGLVLRWTGRKQVEEIRRMQALHKDVLDEREARIREKDARIKENKDTADERLGELRSEIKELKEKLSRRSKPKDDVPEKNPDSGGEGNKP